MSNGETRMHFCHDGPRLVGPMGDEDFFTDDPYVYSGVSFETVVGCNRLRCKHCGEMVRFETSSHRGGPHRLNSHGVVLCETPVSPLRQVNRFASTGQERVNGGGRAVGSVENKFLSASHRLVARDVTFDSILESSYRPASVASWFTRTPRTTPAPPPPLPRVNLARVDLEPAR